MWPLFSLSGKQTILQTEVLCNYVLYGNDSTDVTIFLYSVRPSYYIDSMSVNIIRWLGHGQAVFPLSWLSCQRVSEIYTQRKRSGNSAQSLDGRFQTWAQPLHTGWIHVSHLTSPDLSLLFCKIWVTNNSCFTTSWYEITSGRISQSIEDSMQTA